jgi:threonine/homoserine/homoserine lactone efflux protein
MGLLCIHRTLTSGVATGLATGLGAATVHSAYSALAAMGTAAIAKSWIDAHSAALGMISGAILIWFAIRMPRANILVGDEFSFNRVPLTRAYLSAIVIGIANPLTLILFFAALQAFADQSSSSPLVAGVFIGSAVWWIVLSGVVAIARVRLDPTLLSLCGKLASLTLIALGACTLLRAAGRVIC